MIIVLELKTVNSSLHSWMIFFFATAVFFWLTASWVAETCRQTSVVLPLWQFMEVTFRQRFCLFLHDVLENEGLIVSFQQQAHRVRMRWWEMSADSTVPCPASTDKQTADRRDPMYHQARLSCHNCHFRCLQTKRSQLQFASFCCLKMKYAK